VLQKFLQCLYSSVALHNAQTFYQGMLFSRKREKGGFLIKPMYGMQLALTFFLFALFCAGATAADEDMMLLQPSLQLAMTPADAIAALHPSPGIWAVAGTQGTLATASDTAGDGAGYSPIVGTAGLSTGGAGGFGGGGSGGGGGLVFSPEGGNLGDDIGEEILMMPDDEMMMMTADCDDDDRQQQQQQQLSAAAAGGLELTLMQEQRMGTAGAGGERVGRADSDKENAPLGAAGGKAAAGGEGVQHPGVWPADAETLVELGAEAGERMWFRVLVVQFFRV
jgi:hypothetical protein